jgi:hypothetical protein
MCLAVGFTLGGLILAAKGGAVDGSSSRGCATCVLLLFGWLIQLAMGVAYWILPRTNTDRGRPRWAWSSFVLFQLGLVLTLGSVLSLWLPSTRFLNAPGVLCQTLGVLAFAIHAWPRIKPVMVRAYMQAEQEAKQAGS